MSAPMVRAILDGRKTQTRRIVKPQPRPNADWAQGNPTLVSCGFNGGTGYASYKDAAFVRFICPYGQPGDRLWCKETFRNQAGNMEYVALRYRADDAIIKYEDHSLKDVSNKWKWRPSIFMPRWASRITLEIVGVRVQRLQDIIEEDAKAEGAERGCWCNDGVFCEPMDEVDEKMASYRSGYRFLWESINGKGSWDVNPWVWCISFKRV